MTPQELSEQSLCLKEEEEEKKKQQHTNKQEADIVNKENNVRYSFVYKTLERNLENLP